MTNTVTFKNTDGFVPSSLIWNGIYFNFKNAVIDTVFSEKQGDTFKVHTLYQEFGDKWKGYTVIETIDPDHVITFRFLKLNEMYQLTDALMKKCAFIECTNMGKYWQPSETDIDLFPTKEQVYAMDRSQYKQFTALYFKSKI